MSPEAEVLSDAESIKLRKRQWWAGQTGCGSGLLVRENLLHWPHGILLAGWPAQASTGPREKSSLGAQLAAWGFGSCVHFQTSSPNALVNLMHWRNSPSKSFFNRSIVLENAPWHAAVILAVSWRKEGKKSSVKVKSSSKISYLFCVTDWETKKNLVCLSMPHAVEAC